MLGGLRSLGLACLAVATVGCSDIKKTITGSEDSDVPAGIQLTAESQTVQPNGATNLDLKVTRKNGEPVKDGTRVEIRARLGRIEPADIRTHDGGTARVAYRAGSATGTDRLEAVSGDARAELTLTIQAPAAPPPPPAPPPAPAPPGGAAFDLRSVVWLDPDVSGWPETSRITGASIEDPPICFPHTKAGQWPVRDGAEGNPWIFVNLNGQWYGATWEWLAPGQTCKHVTRDTIGPHIGRAPLSSWRPRSGEWVGLMVSARARFRADTVAERSNIVMVQWP